ncbi:hypothetical protein BVRB_5g120650 [Beta vulgaris subsp. vulgaris]|nr:hypothetical protein BVRB_5g120650 [Beta vulgaris subsp. vulgaris]
MASSQEKTQWPELVGENGKEAAKIIEKENPSLHTIVLLIGSPVTKDYRTDRVRIFVDCKGIVGPIPRIG